MSRKRWLTIGLIAMALTLIACGGLPIGQIQNAVESAKEAVDSSQGLLETAQPLALTAAASAPELLETAQPLALTAAADAQEQVGEVKVGENNSPFPVPDGAENLMTTSEMANYQVNLTLEAAMQYYRDQLGAQGLVERTNLTMAEAGTFSMVFDNAPDGKSVVVQGVSLGEIINVNIRYEMVD
jgi:hypothetical protein